MTKPVTALCNHCGKITDVVFKETHHPNKIRETYFKCQYCYYHYTSFVTDTKVRKMQKKAKDLRMSGRRTNKTQELFKLQEQINERMSWLKNNLIQFGRADL